MFYYEVPFGRLNKRCSLSLSCLVRFRKERFAEHCQCNALNWLLKTLMHLETEDVTVVKIKSKTKVSWH